MRFFDTDIREQRVQGFLQSVQTTRPAPKEKPPAPELPENSLKVLIKALLEPGIWLLVLYSALGLHPAEGKAALNDLLARGLVRAHRFPRKGRGGQPQALEVLPKGLEELAKRGITPPPRRIARGGWKHDVYARLLEKWAKTQGFHHWFEKTLGQKAFDFVYEDKQGNLRAIEICLSGSVEWNASQAIKAAEVQGISEVVLACERPDFLKEIMAEIGKVDALGLYKGKIVGKLLADFMD